MDLLDNNQFKWVRHLSSGTTGPKIDYWISVLAIRDSGHVELLTRWEPLSHCHFHRHRAETTSIVLRGELHVADYCDGKVTHSRVRTAGHRAFGSGDEVHREWGGPEGALVYFSLYAEDGILADQLSDRGALLKTTTIDDLKLIHELQE